MLIVLKRDLKPIKNGWSSESPALGIAAHGFSQDVADKNLERAARLFLTPFEREGTFDQRLAALGLQAAEGGPELRIVLE